MKLVRLGLVLWIGFCVKIPAQTNSLTYEGKTVEQWFQAYVAGDGMRVPPDAYSVRNGEFLRLTPDEDKPDPALSAFRALGEKAVPFLIQRLQASAKESDRTRLERRQAIELIHRLGDGAGRAGPALLALLPAATDEQNEEICAAVRAVHTDRELINKFLLDPDSQRSDAELVQLARRLGWSGADVARRLGGMVNSKDRELARAAMTLLEAAGAGANPAADQVASALRSADQELRYIAVRCLSNLVTNTPMATEALRTVADDSNDMVRSVARVALAKTNSISPPK